DREETHLGPTRSVRLLEEEEKKHIALFRRYEEYLRTLMPEECERFDNLTKEPAKLLEILDCREKYPNAATHHFLFWLGTVFFEEYTVYLYEKLSEESSLIQPAWLSAHYTHWREEVQHVMTDAYHIAALNLSEEERYTWSRVFFTWLEENYEQFAGFHVPIQMIQEKYPELAEQLGEPSFVETPFFQDICQGPGFRQTRKASPCIPDLLKQKTEQGKTKSSTPTGRFSIAQAIISSPPPQEAPQPEESVPDRVRKAIAANPNAGIVFVQDDGTETFERYKDLWTRAEITLAGLRKLGCRKGDSAILQLRRNEDFLACLWGCFLGGMKAVPLALPTARHTLEEDRRKLLRIHELMDHPLVIVDESLREFLKEFELPETVQTA
ncbi:MAG: hypothetical protein QF645_12990, partial [Planctomycetota bacterium]|nr:hypothetical protein [Planctomycetota bacterium]